MLLTYISPAASDVEDVFMCLFAICLSSSVKHLFMSFAHFRIAFFLATVFREFFVYSTYQPFVEYVTCKYFLLDWS